MEVEPRWPRRGHAGRLERRAHRLLVVDHKPEVAGSVGPVGAPGGKRDELVTEVDERHLPRAATQLQRPEDPLVELDRLVDRPHIERHVIDADEPRHRHEGSWRR